MRLTSCPHCDKKYFVPEEWQGKCPECGKPTGKQKAKAYKRIQK